MTDHIMKLQKILANKVEGKKYHKYQITLPKKLIEALDWEAGAKLEAKIKDDGIFLKPEG